MKHDGMIFIQILGPMELSRHCTSNGISRHCRIDILNSSSHTRYHLSIRISSNINQYNWAQRSSPVPNHVHTYSNSKFPSVHFQNLPCMSGPYGSSPDNIHWQSKLIKLRP